MANKRMFNNSVIQTDDFLKLPHSAITLYFFLNATADNEGFNAAPEDVMRRTRTSTDDLQLLISKRFVLVVGSGVIVITHWFIHNYVRNDRNKGQVNYLQEKKFVSFDDEGLYMLIDETDQKMSLYDMIQQNDGKPLSLQKIKEYLKNVYNQIDTLGGIPLVDPEEERGEEIRGEEKRERAAHVPYAEDHLYGHGKNILLSDKELEYIYETYENPELLIDKVGFILLNSKSRKRSHFGYIGKIAIEDKWPKRDKEKKNMEVQELSEEEKKEIRIQDIMATHDMEYDEAKLFLDEERSKAADEAMEHVRKLLFRRREKRDTDSGYDGNS